MSNDSKILTVENCNNNSSNFYLNYLFYFDSKAVKTHVHYEILLFILFWSESCT